MLEYGQRLSTRRRAILCDEEHSCGEFLFQKALSGGRQCLGEEHSGLGSWVVGGRADWIVLDDDHAAFKGVDASCLLDRWVFCQWGNTVKETWVGGRKICPE